MSETLRSAGHHHRRFLPFAAGCAIILAGIIALLPPPVFAGEWRVTPIRLFFDRGVRTGILNVQNDGDTPMTFGVKAMQWTQDAEGKDQYSETDDLIFFPKILTIPPREDRVIRIGSKHPGGPRELTYRLFIEEEPPPRKEAKNEGATVSVKVRFAVPLFISPTKADPAGKLASVELRRGTLSATLQNTGNVNFRLASLEIHGKNAEGGETFKKSVEGWYLLNGVTRTFRAEIPVEACLQSEAVEVEGATDREITLKGRLTVDKSQCKP